MHLCRRESGEELRLCLVAFFRRQGAAPRLPQTARSPRRLHQQATVPIQPYMTHHRPFASGLTYLTIFPLTKFRSIGYTHSYFVLICVSRLAPSALPQLVLSAEYRRQASRMPGILLPRPPVRVFFWGHPGQPLGGCGAPCVRRGETVLSCGARWRKPVAHVGIRDFNTSSYFRTGGWTLHSLLRSARCAPNCVRRAQISLTWAALSVGVYAAETGVALRGFSGAGALPAPAGRLARSCEGVSV